MRGWDAKSEELFSCVNCEARVPKDHPLRPIRQIVNEALAALSPEFEKLYAKVGRPSIPPERLLRALLLQAFYSVRSELPMFDRLSMMCSQITYPRPPQQQAEYMRSMSPVPKSPAGTGSASRAEGCSSATDVAETVVAGRQDARPQRDSWCEVGWPGRM
jgi:Transposase domain (DUF772)